ncbi:S8 family serine peptidase [Mesorhizobium sp. CCNWLY176]
MKRKGDMFNWLRWIRAKRLLLAIMLACIPIADSSLLPGFLETKPAFADDDDGGDDDGGRSGASSRNSDPSIGSRRSSGRNLFRGLRNRFLPRAQRSGAARPYRAQAPQPPLPVHTTDEIVATGLTAQQIDQLTAYGFVVLDHAEIPLLVSEVVKLRKPSSMSLEAARDRIRTFGPPSIADFNHFYRPEQEAIPECSGPHCDATNLVGWPIRVTGPTNCGGDVIVGLIDTAINADHATFAKGQVEIVRLVDEELPQSGRQHGTAVAALLVGAADSSTPGLMPGAKLIAVDTFQSAARQDDRSDVYELIRAMDLLASRGAHVINMSLSGPQNMLLERLVTEISDRNVVIVAAAGNKGPKADPAYPAAYPQVIAVTAVDRNKRVYRRAGRGKHIDLAAPGVEIWTAASVSGARLKTGTSFAAPFVTAAAALLRSSGQGMTSAQVHETLTKSAQDLGDLGKDPTFGWGLLNASTLCAAKM